MKLLFSLCIGGFRAVRMSNPAAEAAITLVANGKSDYAIVISDKASLSELHAAKELQTFLKRYRARSCRSCRGRAIRDKKMIVLGDRDTLSGCSR